MSHYSPEHVYWEQGDVLGVLSPFLMSSVMTELFSKHACIF